MNTVLLTGGTGFVGSHLLEELVQKHKVILLKRTTSNTERVDHVIGNNLIKVVNADKIKLRSIFDKYKIDIIAHLATSYGREGKIDADILRATTVLPMELLELGIENGVRAFVNTNSYFNQSISLQDNIGLHAESKRDFIKYAKNKVEKSGNNIKLLDYMMGHVYGPRDSSHKLFPSIIKKLSTNEPSVDLVRGNNQRNFIYVKDAVKVYMYMIDYVNKMPNQYQDFYDRTGEIITVRHMVELVKEFTQSTSRINYGAIADRPNEIMTITPDMDTLTHKLGWRPKYKFEQGLLETISYYKPSNQ